MSKKIYEYKEVDVGQVPKLLGSQVEWLWIWDYWDGPLSGMVKHNGSWYWCFCFSETEKRFKKKKKSQNAWFRRFLIVELTSEQLADEKYWNDLFCRHVRTDTTSYEARRSNIEIEPTNNHKLFYEPYSKRAKPDYSKIKLSVGLSINKRFC